MDGNGGMGWWLLVIKDHSHPFPAFSNSKFFPKLPKFFAVAPRWLTWAAAVDCWPAWRCGKAPVRPWRWKLRRTWRGWHGGCCRRLPEGGLVVTMMYTYTYTYIYIWYMVYDIWYMIYDIWYMIYDIWYMVYDICSIEWLDVIYGWGSWLHQSFEI